MKIKKVCPYRQETVIYHSNKKNYLVPDSGINKILNYDVTNVFFKPCLQEECMLFDSDTGRCTMNKSDF